MMLSLFIYRYVAFKFLTKNTAYQALHESLVFVLYSYLTAWNARKSASRCFPDCPGATARRALEVLH